MGKKVGVRKGTLREEAAGRKQTKGGSNNLKSILKVKHFENLATWASGEASIPSLGAFYGHRLASVRKALDVEPDPSLFTCQRCETVLQPGFNCTVWIEKNRVKPRHRSEKPNNFTENNVVYACHFCSQRNLKRGTPKGHVKNICLPKIRKSTRPKSDKSILQQSVGSEQGIIGKDEIIKLDEIPLPAIAEENPAIDCPITPAIVKAGVTLLDSKRRKRNRSAAKKAAEHENSSTPIDVEKTAGGSNKRRKKSWTTLKDIAESSGNKRSIANLKIPFPM